METTAPLLVFMALQAFILALFHGQRRVATISPRDRNSQLQRHYLRVMWGENGINLLLLFLKIFLLNQITFWVTLKAAIALDNYSGQYGPEDWSVIGVLAVGIPFTYSALFIVWLDARYPHLALIQEILGWLGGLVVGLMVCSGVVLGLIGLLLRWANHGSYEYDDSWLWVILGTVFPGTVVWLQAVVLCILNRATRSEQIGLR